MLIWLINHVNFMSFQIMAKPGFIKSDKLWQKKKNLSPKNQLGNVHSILFLVNIQRFWNQLGWQFLHMQLLKNHKPNACSGHVPVILMTKIHQSTKTRSWICQELTLLKIFPDYCTSLGLKIFTLEVGTLLLHTWVRKVHVTQCLHHLLMDFF